MKSGRLAWLPVSAMAAFGCAAPVADLELARPAARDSGVSASADAMARPDAAREVPDAARPDAGLPQPPDAGPPPREDVCAPRTWCFERTPTRDALRDVSVLGPGHALALGSTPALHVWRPGRPVESIALPELAGFGQASWSSLWALGEDDVLVVGMASRVAHFARLRGGRIDRQELPVPNSTAGLAPIVGVADDDLWTHDQLNVMHWDGNRWSIVGDLAAGSGYIGGLQSLERGAVVAITTGTESLGQLRRFAGGRWSTLLEFESMGLSARPTLALADGRLWSVAVEVGTRALRAVRCDLALRCDTLDAPTGATPQAALTAVGDQVWWIDGGRIQTFDGARWVEVVGFPLATLERVRERRGGAWAVGDSIAELRGGAWEPRFDASVSMLGFMRSGPAEVGLIGADPPELLRGTTRRPGQWDHLALGAPPSAPTYAPIPGFDGGWLSLGAEQQVVRVRSDGTIDRRVPAPPFPLSDLGAAGEQEVPWFLDRSGSTPSLWFFAGRWTPVEGPADQLVQALHVTADGAVFVIAYEVTTGRLALHRGDRAGRWRELTGELVGQRGPMALAGERSDEVWAVMGTTPWRYDGQRATQMMTSFGAHALAPHPRGMLAVTVAELHRYEGDRLVEAIPLPGALGAWMFAETTAEGHLRIGTRPGHVARWVP